MMRSFLIYLFIGISSSIFAQENALIYKSILPGFARSFEPFKDGSGYAVSFDWYNQFGDPNVNIGIWEDAIHTIPDSFTYYAFGTVIYNLEFTPISTMDHFRIPDLFPVSNDKVVLNFNESLYDTDIDIFPTSPPITNYPSETFGRNIFIEFNAFTDSVKGLMNLSSTNLGVNDMEPYSGYYTAITWDTQNYTTFRNTSAIIGDSELISFLPLFDSQVLNGDFEYDSQGGQENVLRTRLNLQTNVLTSDQIGSSTGSQTTFLVAPSDNGEDLFRVGIVRGNDTPVSVSGAQISMVANDSLYHAFITKESSTGETEWLRELYAYNNVNADTTAPTTNLQMQNRFYSIIEKDESVFISTSLGSLARINDTLIYRDFAGQEHHYTEMIPYYGSNPQSLQIPIAESRVYKLDTNGNLIGKLSYIETIEGYTFSSQSGWFSNKNYLFKVSDKLAWVHTYFEETNTTITFRNEGINGNIENTNINFPAGKGMSILWLDSDLNILDNWIIPYQSDNVRSMEINSVTAYNADTLLIQGNIAPGTTTSLDPFGIAQSVSYSSGSTFFAFYSAPEILTSVDQSATKNLFTIFPIPADNQFNITGIATENSRYQIFDISGRMIQAGILNSERVVNSSRLHSGMYILRIDSEKGSASRKFMVK